MNVFLERKEPDIDKICLCGISVLFQVESIYGDVFIHVLTAYQGIVEHICHTCERHEVGSANKP